MTCSPSLCCTSKAPQAWEDAECLSGCSPQKGSKGSLGDCVPQQLT